MDYNNLFESFFRWLHLFAGIMWIGILYFFNFVNASFAATMDGETKKKVVPELMPRALHWFRHGALATWMTGIVLLVYVFYHQPQNLMGSAEWAMPRYAAAGVMVGFLLVAAIVYDLLAKKVFVNNQVAFWVGLLLASAVPCVLENVKFLSDRGFTYRGYSIHFGAMLGTIMAFNVWMRIWPAQRKIITAIKAGEKPDAALVTLAGTRSKHNTYMSVPLLFMMTAQHGTWASGGGPLKNEFYLPLVVLVGWLLVFCVYKKAAAVKGF